MSKQMALAPAALLLLRFTDGTDGGTTSRYRPCSLELIDAVHDDLL
jgi:hypothetical protein